MHVFMVEMLLAFCAHLYEIETVKLHLACKCVFVKLKNPAMQSLVTNAKALQALVKIQQGVDMLHTEAPNLVSR